MRTSSKLLVVAALVPAALACACAPSKEQSVGGSAKIVGGFTAPEGAFPGTVAVYFSKDAGDDDDDDNNNNNLVANDDSYQACGGSLIAPDWVMTAGHCVEPNDKNGGIDHVVIGRQDLTKTTVGEERTVDQVIRHEGFNSRTLDNDVALLHLSKPSTQPRVTLITPDQLSTLIDGAAATVVGWGSTAESGKESDTLLEVTVPIMSNQQCASYPQYGDLTANQICAAFTSGGYDSCQGDSGGPIFINIEGKPVQFGTVSWGIGCAEAGEPGVYLRIGNYVGWLFDHTNGAAGTQTAPSTDSGAPPAPPADGDASALPSPPAPPGNGDAGTH